MSHSSVIHFQECQSFEVVDPHGMRIAREQQAETLFALPDLFLGLFTLSYVAGYPLDGDQFA